MSHNDSGYQEYVKQRTWELQEDGATTDSDLMVAAVDDTDPAGFDFLASDALDHIDGFMDWYNAAQDKPASDQPGRTATPNCWPSTRHNTSEFYPWIQMRYL